MSAFAPSARTRAGASDPVAIWLALCCTMVFVMVVLGGITRLTESGLSITEWQPLMGWIPPATDAAWHELFRKYQATPEYQQINAGMTLAEFKAIFWVEYVHRLWGRLIGLVYALPLAAFAFTGRIEKRLLPHLLFILLLGGLQGGLGWFMVQSGLVERTDVSPYRLTAHLAVAFVIYGYMIWLLLGLLYRDRRDTQPPAALRLKTAARALVALVFVTVMAGGLTAGLNAGFAFNTFPLMAGQWVPPGFLDMTPWWLNFFENIAAVQFTHRVLAVTTLAAVLAFWLAARRRKIAGSAAAAVNTFAALALIQVGLGVATLLLVVPIPLAAAHQAGAMALFTAALWTAQRLGASR